MNDKDKIKKVESYRWVVWTILALLYVFVTFHRMGTGVVRNELEEDFSIGAAQFANIGSMYFYAYFIMQIPSGILADKFGPKITVTIFSLLAAAGSVIFGLAPVINVAYIGQFKNMDYIFCIYRFIYRICCAFRNIWSFIPYAYIQYF